jgi:Undecaprenyl-phosphate glucose phosphotransferase
MLKSYERLFSLIQKFLDVFMITASWFGCYYFRFYILPYGEIGQQSLFIKANVLIAVISIYFFRKYSLYSSHRLKSRVEESFKVFKANLFSTLIFIVLFYFLADKKISRAVIILYFVSSTFLLIFARMSVRNLLRAMRSRGKNLRHILLVGNGTPIENYLKTILNFKESGIKFVGWLDSNELASKYHIKELSGTIEEFRKIYNPDSIVISYMGEDTSKIDNYLKAYHNDIVPIQILPDLTYSFVGYRIEDLCGIPVLSVNQPDFSSIDMTTKRIFDVISTGAGLIFISPILFILAIGVRLSSPGPIFYGQERIGLDGRKFKMWKFRSMRINTDKDQVNIPGWTVANDPRKTNFGNFIRKTSLDELPQLWNVFVGDMSLVGPRPEQPFYVEKFKHEIPAYMLRHKMKAGITGWAQVNGWRGDTSLHKRIECDIYYIRNWSFWLDLRIIFMTFWKGFINKNAY